MNDKIVEKIRNSAVAVALIAGIVTLIVTGHSKDAQWLIFALVMLVLFG